MREKIIECFSILFPEINCIKNSVHLGSLLFFSWDSWFANLENNSTSVSSHHCLDGKRWTTCHQMRSRWSE